MSVLEWQTVKERQKSMIDAWATIHRQLRGLALGELDIVEGRQQRQRSYGHALFPSSHRGFVLING